MVVVHMKEVVKCFGFWTKVIVLSWWSFETHMNPNQKEVVHRRPAPHLYEEKPMQYLMEM